jgi:hypothetical protein
MRGIKGNNGSFGSFAVLSRLRLDVRGDLDLGHAYSSLGRTVDQFAADFCWRAMTLGYGAASLPSDEAGRPLWRSSNHEPLYQKLIAAILEIFPLANR